jgi:hypothetical protein
MARPDSKDLLGDAELIAILGEISFEWDEIEFHMWYLFDAFLNVRWDFSHTILFSQANHRARRDMLAALAEIALANEPEKLRATRALIGRIKRAAKKRNEIAHGLWVDDANKALRRIPMNKTRTQAEGESYRRADLVRARDQLTKLRSDLDDFAYPLWRAKEERHAKQKARTP